MRKKNGEIRGKNAVKEEEKQKEQEERVRGWKCNRVVKIKQIVLEHFFLVKIMFQMF
jgi:hypothetical protein